ncbi:MAG TPA: beta-galactosidase trimerization domain-containing protein [Candidatus Hydrogenedentes bacterium]|nr:beta-galactosidase trimerization domain-containing protein [Candidatus Hydrogenedentota bacterium]HPJ99278.1 beta-galactosidase trimerization domain-containing protein [Candidatus Hydrogenedentota bacterium]
MSTKPLSSRRLSRVPVWALCAWCCAAAVVAGASRAETVFVEAEDFVPTSEGWRAVSNHETRAASRIRTLYGAQGPADATAARTTVLHEAGLYRIWVRYLNVVDRRGPFSVMVSAGAKEIASKTFDLETISEVSNWEYTWQFLEAELPADSVTLTLAKQEPVASSPYVRHVDCLLLTTDPELVPDHVPYGPQTLMRIRLAEGYDRPVYVLLFVDHYRAPWYAHFALGLDGIREGLAVPAEQMLGPGQSTPWCNLSPTIYQDSGAALNLSIRHSYYELAATFRGTVEFAYTDSASDDKIKPVKTFGIDATPNGLVIVVPPDLTTPEHVALLKRDRDFAEETGRLADAFDWPDYGKPPEAFPFLVTANIGGYGLAVDAAVTAREQKTLDYFGFNGSGERVLHGLWFMKDGSYCRPDLDAMRKRANENAADFRESGRNLEQIAVCMLMDEPTGQPAAFCAQDEAYRVKFREWLQGQGQTPEQLLVESWEHVRPVEETERADFPALHYFTQRFRTRALGDFMATQRRIIEEAYGRSFPTLVNFSDGAIYYGNFCGQGVDYFELLDSGQQNAIWGEDWANISSTYQCAAFNVALMQAAARKRGQLVGHYLIAHAGRTAWDTKTKAAGETARGVRIWKNFSYGPAWGTHEGGPPWRTHVWYAKPDVWRANAEITRELGAVEDWLTTAAPAPARVALLYSSSSDIWTMWDNLAFGFDRMHTWLALAHAQIPVDILSERDVADGDLAGYTVCYVSGPNLTRAASAQLRAWVESGGTLWLTAGAATRDEYNRPLDELAPILPAQRGTTETLEAFHYSGRLLHHLNAIDAVTWGSEELEVLSVKEPLTPQSGAEVRATFRDGAAAVVRSGAGKGRVMQTGFLPALCYIKEALNARRAAEKSRDEAVAVAQTRPPEDGQPEATAASLAVALTTGGAAAPSSVERELLDRSYNPWDFPAAIREALLTPIRDADIRPRLTCDTPLVDAVELPCVQGILVVLANHTLRPLEHLNLEFLMDRSIAYVESVRYGRLTFESPRPGTIRWTMPLDASDYVKLGFEGISGTSAPSEPGSRIAAGRPFSENSGALRGCPQRMRLNVE